MNPKRKQRFYWLLYSLLGLSLAVGLSLYALRKNINLYYTPSEVAQGKVPDNVLFRIGGLVKTGSLQRSREDLKIMFILTDTVNEVPVVYQGILPDLFREGQGAVAQGRLNSQKTFNAQQILAKHDEKYMPPAVKDALAKAKHN